MLRSQFESGHLKGSENSESWNSNQGLSSPGPGLLTELEEKERTDRNASCPQLATEGSHPWCRDQIGIYIQDAWSFPQPAAGCETLAVCASLAAERGVWHLMPKDGDIVVMEQFCQLLEPLRKFTDALGSETWVTLSAIKPVLDHITGDVLEENVEDPDGPWPSRWNR